MTIRRWKLHSLELWQHTVTYNLPLVGRYLKLEIEDVPELRGCEWQIRANNQATIWEGRWVEADEQHGLRSLAFGTELYTSALAQLDLVLRLAPTALLTGHRQLQLWLTVEDVPPPGVSYRGCH